jgi:ribonuclease P protein component
MRDRHEASVACAPVQGHPGPDRLTKRSEFLAVAAGRRFHTGRMTVQGLRREAESPAARDLDGVAGALPSGSPVGLRVGLTVTKRVGHATERNRIRRRLRAAIAVAAGPYTGAALDVVLVGRRDSLSAPFPQLVDDLGRALPAVARVSSGSASDTAHHGRSRKPSSDPVKLQQRKSNANPRPR